MAGQFNARHTINPGHLGAFWSRVRDEFPSVHTTQPIATRREVFQTGAQWTPPAIRLAVTNRPDCRLQMTSADDQTWMWQVQSDRLVVNWRKRSSEYPRYSVALDEFERAWGRWARFVDEIGNETGEGIEPVGWELTYVNEIPSGPNELWQSPDQWPGILPGLFAGPSGDVDGLTLAGLHGEWVWKHADPPAELIVSPAPTMREQRHMLVLKLTARGPVGQDDRPAEPMNAAGAGGRPLAAGLNVGHRLIVNMFHALVSDAAKQHWGVHDNA